MALSQYGRHAIRASLAGLTGKRRHGARVRLGSRFRPEVEECRHMDNTKEASRAPGRYHRDMVTARCKSATKARRRA